MKVTKENPQEITYPNSDRVMEYGDTVRIIDSPDFANSEFEATIVGFHGEYAVIEDGDGDCFDVEPEYIHFNDPELDYE